MFLIFICNIKYNSWHPFLMSSSFLLLMSPAIIAFEVYPMARSTNKNFHGILMSLSLICAIVGFAVILDCHNNLSNAGSFKTLHGCVGLFTIIIFILNVCFNILQTQYICIDYVLCQKFY